MRANMPWTEAVAFWAFRETRQYVQKVTNAYFQPGSGRDSGAVEPSQTLAWASDGLEWPGCLQRTNDVRRHRPKPHLDSRAFSGSRNRRVRTRQLASARTASDKDSDSALCLRVEPCACTQLEVAICRATALARQLQRHTIAAYHKVYLLDPQAEEVTASVDCRSHSLYCEMGRQFPKYFQSAIDMYTLIQYPRTQYRAAAFA